MSGRRRGLGRGLDALLGAEPSRHDASGEATGRVTELAIEQLTPNRNQPRSRFDPSSIEALATSIRSQGVIQPLVVTPGADGRYTIVAGERRWRAAQQAALAKVPVVVRNVTDDRELLELALVENVQRQDLDPIEEAEAYRSLAEQFELSQQAIGQRVGKSRPAIANALRLLRLPGTIQDSIRDGRLTAGQARPLLGLGEADRQREMAERAIKDGLSARDLERLCAQEGSRTTTPKREAPVEDPNTRAAAERLMRCLQTRVDIVRKSQGGQLRIHFHSEDELIRLYDLLTQAKGDD